MSSLQYITISSIHSCFNTSRNLLLVQLLKLPSSLIPLLFSILHCLKVNTNASNIRFSLTYKTLSILLNLLISITWSLFSLLAALVRHLSSPSLVHPHLPFSKSQIAISVMHHPVFGIIFLPHSVNLVHHLLPPSHHPSLPLSSIPDLKLTCSTNPHRRSSRTHQTVHWTSTGLPSQTSLRLRLCVMFCFSFSSSVIFF